jgi:adenosylcobinamide-GDP ribazoletransferase
VSAGWRLALTTFTVLPVRAGRVDRASAGHAMELGPAVGLGLGVAAAAVLVGFQALTPPGAGPLLPAALTVATLAVLTRGLHLDGLADTADALGSYVDAEQALAVMKDPAIGGLGAVTLVLTLLVQVGALAAATRDGRGTMSTVLAVVVGRLVALWACTPGTAAARTGGMGALVAGSARRLVALAMTAGTALFAAGYGLLDDDGTAYGTVRGLLALAAGLGAARLLRRHAVRRFGGITGDVLGAGIEVATTVVLVVMSLDRPSFGRAG